MFGKSFMVLCAALVLSAWGFGQVTTGTVSGTIKDNSGAVLPAATVQIRNVDTGISRNVTADALGYYTAPNLSLGQYEITAGLSGFQTGVRRGITLNVGQNAVVDFTLQVGAVTERVEVVAEAPLIETTTATVAHLINERQVQDLPLNARDLIHLPADPVRTAADVLRPSLLPNGIPEATTAGVLVWPFLLRFPLETQKRGGND